MAETLASPTERLSVTPYQFIKSNQLKRTVATYDSEDSKSNLAMNRQVSRMDWVTPRGALVRNVLHRLYS